MFARVFALLPLALLASASHIAARNSCSTGDQQCCQVFANQAAAQEALGSGVQVLDLLNGLTGQVVADCIPIVGNACNQQAVCCSNVEFNGLVNVGCNAISL